MNTIKNQLNQLMKEGFVAARYSDSYGEVTLSNRPDLCDYQCNGALQAAKHYKKSPLQIANEVVESITTMGSPLIASIEVLPPGFINIKISLEALSAFLNHMNTAVKLGYKGPSQKKSVLIDYGGANVAKALHVGHLRSAVIGESLRRLYLYSGHQVIGDIHLGDWGLQMGYVIEMLKIEQPHLSYFASDFSGPYPCEAPFSIAELSALYTLANQKSKTDESFKESARQATVELQDGRPGYRALWGHILSVSVADLKKNYHALNVDFDLWLGESDSQVAIPVVLSLLEQQGLLVESQGAKVVFVAEPADKKPVPPCLMVKSNGAALYGTTDLATLYQRVQQQHLDEIIYVVDKRQSLHFEQVFRVARKAHFVKEGLELNFIGFGTMNGADGRPFKTREGGIMSLEDLISLLRNSVKAKLAQGSQTFTAEEIDDISIKVGLAAMKFADLSNQAERDYIFDLEQFMNFDGKTGPYIQYTLVRIRSLLKKASKPEGASQIIPACSDVELDLHKALTGFNDLLLLATEEKAPHKLCEAIYDISRLFNRFYHETPLLDEQNSLQRHSWLSLLQLIDKVLSTSLNLLGMDDLDKM